MRKRTGGSIPSAPTSQFLGNTRCGFCVVPSIRNAKVDGSIPLFSTWVAMTVYSNCSILEAMISRNLLNPSRVNYDQAVNTKTGSSPVGKLKLHQLVTPETGLVFTSGSTPE